MDGSADRDALRFVFEACALEEGAQGVVQARVDDERQRHKALLQRPGRLAAPCLHDDNEQPEYKAGNLARNNLGTKKGARPGPSGAAPKLKASRPASAGARSSAPRAAAASVQMTSATLPGGRPSTARSSTSACREGAEESADGIVGTAH